MARRIARDRGQHVRAVGQRRRVPGQLRTAPSCLRRRAATPSTQELHARHARRRRRRSRSPSPCRSRSRRRGRTRHATVGAVVSLATVTVTAAAVVSWPAASRATAVSTWRAVRSARRVPGHFVRRAWCPRRRARRRRRGTARPRPRDRRRRSRRPSRCRSPSRPAAGLVTETVGAVVSFVDRHRDRRGGLVSGRVASHGGEQVAAVLHGRRVPRHFERRGRVFDAERLVVQKEPDTW